MLSAQEIASMTATVASSLDVSVLVKRRNPANDGYGHTTDGTLSTVGTFAVNVMKPSATQLQAFAGIIGSQQALMIRFASASDIREGDFVTYLGRTWLVNNVQKAESYTFANDALLTSVQ